MSKYEEPVARLLTEDLKSTNELLEELQAKFKKTINWHVLYRILSELEKEGKADKVETKAGFFWRKK